jgi:hypothetical protein
MTETPDTPRLANLAAAQRYVDAWLAGDFPAMLATYHDDFVLHWFGTNPMAGVKHGKAAAVEALLAFTRRTGRRLVAVDNVMADAGRAVITAVLSLSLTSTGPRKSISSSARWGAVIRAHYPPEKRGPGQHGKVSEIPNSVLSTDPMAHPEPPPL